MTGNPSRFLFDHSVLGRHKARYFLDESCGYIFAESPTWRRRMKFVSEWSKFAMQRIVCSFISG
jgi:hypothetical protein